MGTEEALKHIPAGDFLRVTRDSKAQLPHDKKVALIRKGNELFNRGEIELAYDTRPNTADVYSSCAMMRQNAHKIDLFGNSAVPIPAAAIRGQGAKSAEAPSVASPGNRLFQVVDRWMSVLDRN